MKDVGKLRGFTLIELLTVIAIMAILLSLAIFQSRSIVGKKSIENELKKMQADIMSTRVRAMERNRSHFVSLRADMYLMYEDTNENQAWDATDTLVVQQTLDSKYPLVWSGALNTFRISDKGIIDAADVGTVRITIPAGESGSVDCLAIAEIKVRLGRWVGAECIPQ